MFVGWMGDSFLPGADGQEGKRKERAGEDSSGHHPYVSTYAGAGTWAEERELF